MPAYELVSLIVGLLALLFGRRLFWLLAGLAGFLLGMRLAVNALGEGWMATLLALAVGLVAAWLVVALQRLAIVVVGGLAGAIVLPRLAELAGLSAGIQGWPLLILGAVAGAIFLSLAFDWGLIVLSSVAGADAILDAIRPRFGLPAESAGVLLVVLAVLGMVFQASQMRRRG